MEQGTPQVRLRGPEGTMYIEPGPDDWFQVGEHMTEDYNIIEWRVDFPPFEDIPWFRDDIMWDPAPPELIPILVDLGFAGVAHPEMRSSHGKEMTILLGCDKFGLDVNEVTGVLRDKGFEVMS